LAPAIDYAVVEHYGNPSGGTAEVRRHLMQAEDELAAIAMAVASYAGYSRSRERPSRSFVENRSTGLAVMAESPLSSSRPTWRPRTGLPPASNKGSQYCLFCVTVITANLLAPRGEDCFYTTRSGKLARDTVLRDHPSGPAFGHAIEAWNAGPRKLTQDISPDSGARTEYSLMRMRPGTRTTRRRHADG